VRVETSVRNAFIAACVALLAGAIAFRSVASAINAWVLKEQAPMREPLGTIPTTLGVWKAVGKDALLNDATIETLGTKFYLNRNFAIEGDPSRGEINLHLAFYTGLIDRVPHVPERCFVAGGLLQVGVPQVRAINLDRSSWRMDAGPINRATGLHYPMASVIDPITMRSSEVHLPLGEAAMTVSEFQDSKSPDQRLIAGYFFIANGQMTPRAGDVRALSYSLTERYAYFCKVQFTGQYRAGDNSLEKFEAQVADLLRELLPHLMLRLPDWPEYEVRSSTGSSAS